MVERDEVTQILIVDDDRTAIHLMRNALSRYRQLRFATNGPDALRLARERTPDIILLDALMPGQTGFEVCADLKRDAGLRHVPVIFVTSFDDIQFESQALELGAADFIAKPISAPRVQLRVRLHLQLKRQIDQLKALTLTDELTGVGNRRAFNDRIEIEWRRALRTQSSLSVLLVDIDYFKAFNDVYGHVAGDACLRVMGQCIRDVIRRPADFATRLGGEEFAIVLPETPPDGARHVAEALRKKVAEHEIPHAASPVKHHLSVSVGIASCVPSGVDPALLDELVRAADQALYRAKANGRDRVEIAEAAAPTDVS